MTSGFSLRLPPPPPFAAARTVAVSRAAHPGPHPTQASICFSMAIPGSVPLLRDAPALTGAPFALPFGSF